MKHRFRACSEVAFPLLALLLLVPGNAPCDVESAWEDITPPAWNTGPTQIGLDPANPDRFFVGTSGEGLYYTTDGAQSWIHVLDDFRVQPGAATDIVRDIAVNPEDIQELAALTVSGSFYSTNGGANWTRDDANNSGQAPMIGGAFAEFPDGSGLAASDANGAVWFHEWNDPWDTPTTWSKTVAPGINMGISFDRSDPPTLYVGNTMRSMVWTDDMGQSLHYCTGLPDNYGRAVLADPEIPERVLVAVDNGLFLNTDPGECDWNQIGIGLPSYPLTALAMIHNPTDADVIFLGTGNGVFVSEDRGNTFTPMPQAGMGHLVVSDLAIHPLNPDWLIAACHSGGPGSGGVYRIQIDDATGVAEADLPEVTSVRLANRPNPFNPQTTIAFELPATGHVRLAVHDSHGRRVANLLNRRLDAGRHSVVWRGVDDRGRALGSGVYFGRMETEGGDVSNNRMVLIR